MATIAQTTPFTDAVSTLESGLYTNQLLAAGSTAPVAWTTTITSPSITVTPTGFVTTTGQLDVGVYTCSGTMQDASLNTGLWSFTLTVKSVLAPQATVIPAQQASPLGIEMQVPFQIDPATGGTSYLTDYGQILAQHILTIIMTSPGERLMSPTYGFGLEQQVFAPLYTRTPSMLTPDLQTAISALEPSVKIVDLTIDQNPNLPNVLDITIVFSVLPSNAVSTVSMSVGGGLNQVVAS